MANTIRIKRGVGKPDSLLEGELAIDTSTGRLYSLVNGVVAELNEPPEGFWSKLDVSSLPPNAEVIASNYLLDAYQGARVFYANIEDETMLLTVDSAEISGTVQATDFLDADGKSIINTEVSEDHVHAPNIKVRSNMNRDGGIDATLDGGQINAKLLLHGGYFNVTNGIPERGPSYLYMTTDEREGRTPNLGDPVNDHLWGNAYFDGVVQATDYLDADGNSIVNKREILTQAEYDAISQPDDDTVYFIV